MKEFQPKTLKERLMKEKAYDEGYNDGGRVGYEKGFVEGAEKAKDIYKLGEDVRSDLCKAYEIGYSTALEQVEENSARLTERLEKVASEAFDAGYDYAVVQYEQYEQYEQEDSGFSQCFYTESEQELDTVISSLFKDKIAEEKGCAVGEDLDEHKYPHYFKDVRLLDYIDVYMINKLFPSNDDSGAIDHARKKLLVTGNRGGGKSSLEDVIEARDTLNRYLEIEGSNTKPNDECDTGYGTSHWGYHGE